ncbi:WYL domain-containing protein [Micromonospora sp. NPDC053740]|uniref:WYL domain-containing protein n=1 Tax=Micromonospora sp. NPDC053740 TaxID=3155173 RepID=UPI00342E0B14
MGYDNDRDDRRIFRVDRITDLRPTRTRVAARQLPASDAASFMAEKLLELTPVYRAVVTLHAPIERMAGPLGDAGVDLEPIDATSRRLRSNADTLEWLAWRLLTLGYDMELHEPPELIAHLRQIGSRATRAASPSAA